MAKLAKFLQGVAGAAGGAGLNVEEVFSTYLYDGNSSTQTITNGIDLDGEGGLVWNKERSGNNGHFLFDTERGATKRLRTHGTHAEVTDSTSLTAFNSNGFDIGSTSSMNTSGQDYVSWTFRKAPKFFDVVTYTGDGTASNIISHNLGSIPGFVVVKRTDSTGDWHIAARYSNGKYVHGNASFPTALNLTSAANSITSTNGASDMSLTSTTFDAKKINGYNTHNGTGNLTNINGATYVAYLFAHNDDDGEFGPDGDQDIIKCGSYTGNGSTTGPEIDLGFEPQWLMIKNASGTGNWVLYDVMRGLPIGSGDKGLLANSSAAEDAGFDNVDVTSTGFKLTSTNGNFNTNSSTYIYIAIRRGPMAVPEDADDVFAVDASTSDSSGDVLASTFPVDAYLYGRRGGGSHGIMARLTETRLFTDSTSAEGALGSYVDFDRQTGIKRNALLGNASTVDYMWRRAPNYFDVVCYTGNGTAGRTVSHNLGVAPEMMWVKKRNQAENWLVYHSATGNTQSLRLNSSIAAYTDTNWNNTTPTDSVFSLGSNSVVNYSGHTFIAYLFASLDGVSKVGSYTGTGSTLNIDCGFSSGARFVLIKRSNGTGNWFVLDTERGIVAGNDPLIELNSSSAEDDDYDNIDPYNSGFTLTAYGGTSPYLNISGATYIFYAIA